MARTVIGKLAKFLKHTELTLEITAEDYEGIEVPLTIRDWIDYEKRVVKEVFDSRNVASS